MEGQSTWHALSYTFINSVFTDKTLTSNLIGLDKCIRHICGSNDK